MEKLHKIKARNLVVYFVLILLIAPCIVSQENPDAVLCGDGICDLSEVDNCSIDCGTGEPSVFVVDSEEEQIKKYVFSGLIFKIIVIFLVLIVIGIIGFVVYSKMKASAKPSVNSSVSMETQSTSAESGEKIPQYDVDLK